MKSLKPLFIILITAFLTSCSSSKPYQLQDKAPLQLSHAYFQDWTTDIKIGSAGTNIIIANLSPQKNVSIDSVFFKKMKGKLIEGRGMYYSQLIRMLPNSQGNKVLTLENFPFKLTNKECVISYIENGVTKYFKVTNVQEREGAHYLTEPPKNL